MNHQHRITDEISAVLAFVGVIWCVFFADQLLPLSELMALVPRRLMGIPGVAAMTFLHQDLSHLVSNSIPLVVLLTLLAGSRANSWSTVASIALLGGGLLWGFGRNGDASAYVAHIGASLLVFGLVTFFLAAALLERRVVPMMIAVLVGFLYGGSTFMGVLPTQTGVSWDGHLCGAIAGVIVAYWQVAERKKTTATD